MTAVGLRRGQARALVRRAFGAPDPLALHRAVSDDGRRSGTLFFETAESCGSEPARSFVMSGAAVVATCRGQRVTLEALSANGEAALTHITARLARVAEIEERERRLAVLLFPARTTTVDLEARLRAPSPLDALRALVSFEVTERATPYALFCAGVFAYDFIDAFEALPKPLSDPLGYPDFTFYLAESLIAIEPAAGRMTVICTAFGSDDAVLSRAIYNDASTRLGDLVERCRAIADRPQTQADRSLSSTREEEQFSGSRATDLARATRVGALAAPGPLGPRDAASASSTPGALSTPSTRDAFTAPGETVDMDDASYAAQVVTLKENILGGDVFQVVPSRTFAAPCPRPIAAYEALRALNPSPYMFFLSAGDHVLFGASPETSVRVARSPSGAREVEIRPIAGTRRRGHAEGGGLDVDLDNRQETELLLDEKERAEHMMLVDLARNDVARVCRPGTRRVERLLTVERFSHVMHLVSRVTGTLRDENDALCAYAAAMNMGTLVGAPKLRAAELLRRHEATKRGPYGGAIGYFTGEGELDTAVIIRSALVKDGVAHVRAGAGVVHDSDPAAEADETRRKAASVLTALRQASRAEHMVCANPVTTTPSSSPSGAMNSPDVPQSHPGDVTHSRPAEVTHSRPGEVTRSRPAEVTHSGDVTHSRPGEVTHSRPGEVTRSRPAEVILIDNFDSFTFNLVDAFERLGCKVRVLRNTVAAHHAVDLARASNALIVLSPGPGAPREAGSCLDILSGAKGRVPVLGVCLGHQAIVEEAGGLVDRADAVVHGKTTRLLHDGRGVFDGVANPLLVGRYHSLATRQVPGRFIVHASIGDMAMAISDPLALQIGFQFHPESILTPAGQTLLENVVSFATIDRRGS